MWTVGSCVGCCHAPRSRDHIKSVCTSSHSLVRSLWTRLFGEFTYKFAARGRKTEWSVFVPRLLCGCLFCVATSLAAWCEVLLGESTLCACARLSPPPYLVTYTVIYSGIGRSMFLDSGGRISAYSLLFRSLGLSYLSGQTPRSKGRDGEISEAVPQRRF